MKKHLAVPYFRQKTDYTCGPACLRMVFAYFDARVSEEMLAKKAGTTSTFGTPHTGLMKAARALGYRATEKRRATLQDIELHLHNQLPVIVNYIEPHEREIHYAVVTGMTKSHIIFHDPDGKHYDTMPKKAFVASWRNRHGSYRWMLVLRPKRKK